MIQFEKPSTMFGPLTFGLITRRIRKRSRFDVRRANELKRYATRLVNDAKKPASAVDRSSKGSNERSKKRPANAVKRSKTL
jgi:hypothetical protein